MGLNINKIKQIKKWLGSGSINIFGRPFSGKDTQARKLAELFETDVIGGGEILRSSKHEDVKKIINTGELAPTDAYLKIVLPFFAQQKYGGKPLILSTVGRWSGEEVGVIRALSESNHELKAVIELDIDEDEVWRRWEAAHELGDRGRRADDAHGKLKTRLEVYKKKTMPVLDFYDNNKLLIKIDGSQSQEEVLAQIIDNLGKLSEKIND